MPIDATKPPAIMPPTATIITSDGAEIPYRIKGSGPAVIMIHGWSQSGAMFQHQLDAWSDRHTVIVPEVRGHGEAPTPAGGLRMARLGRDVAELIEHLGLDRVSLLGWSMGVSVLWVYVDLFGTAKVDRFVLVDQPSMLTVLPGMGEEEAQDAGALFTVPVLYDLYAALRGPDAEATRAGFVAGMVTQTIAPALYDWILAENAKTPGAVAAELLLTHSTNDWRDVLSRIDRPTLVIGGSVSHVPTRAQRYIHQRIAASAYHEFDAGARRRAFPIPGGARRLQRRGLRVFSMHGEAGHDAVIVIGAASGIGRDVVEALRGRGAAVIALDRDAAGLAALAGNGVHAEALDVADEPAVDTAVDRAIAAVEPVSGVVNAAGIGHSIPAAETAVALFRRVLDVNLIGSFVVARAAAARMATGGAIVNVSSVSGMRGNAGRAAYGASKGGVDALTRVLAAKWAGRGIRVNAVAPGPIDTPLSRAVHDAATRAQWKRLVPMARYGTPREVNGAILFLLDPQAAGYVTGQVLCVDGGFTTAGLRAPAAA